MATRPSTKRKSRFPFPILISGPIGSGKSTLAQHMAKKYHAHYISASAIHKEIALEKQKITQAKDIAHGFWESKAGQKGTQLRLKDLKIDAAVDTRILRAIRENPYCISDARLAPWLYKGPALRIWLDANEKERARRVGKRDAIPHGSALAKIVHRMRADTKIFRSLYAIRYGEDLSPFDVVLHNDGFTPAQTFRTITEYVDTLRASHRAK